MAIEISARKRELQGTGPARRLRRQGRVPGIVYGGEHGPVNIELDHKDLFQNLRNEKFHASILTLDVGGAKQQVLLRAVTELVARRPDLRSRLVVPVVGGPSGSGLERPAALENLAAELRIDDVVRFVPPVPQAELASWYGAASLVAVPSYNESFGLVAAEAQACGTPVVAAAVGGLTTVVRDGHSGLLVEGHDAHDWAVALERITDDEVRARLAAGALVQAEQFTWDATAAQTLAVYEQAHDRMRQVAGSTA